MVRQDEVKPALAGADDDGARSSLPSNKTVSLGIGLATGCNCESRAFANTGAPPEVKNIPASNAARIKLRRMISPVETIDNRRNPDG